MKVKEVNKASVYSLAFQNLSLMFDSLGAFIFQTSISTSGMNARYQDESHLGNLSRQQLRKEIRDHVSVIAPQTGTSPINTSALRCRHLHLVTILPSV